MPRIQVLVKKVDMKIIKIELDEQIQLNGSYWVFERSNWKERVRGIKFEIDERGEVVIADIIEMNIIEMQDYIQNETCILIKFWTNDVIVS